MWNCIVQGRSTPRLGGLEEGDVCHPAVAGRSDSEDLPEAWVGIEGRPAGRQHTYLVAPSDRVSGEFDRLGNVPFEIQAEGPTRRQHLELAFEFLSEHRVLRLGPGYKVCEPRHCRFPSLLKSIGVRCRAPSADRPGRACAARVASFFDPPGPPRTPLRRVRGRTSPARWGRPATFSGDRGLPAGCNAGYKRNACAGRIRASGNLTAPSMAAAASNAKSPPLLVRERSRQ